MGVGSQAPDPGFDIQGDEMRFAVKNYNRMDVCRNLSISAGNDMLCLACGPHHSYRERIAATDPLVMIISDQFFLPMLPGGTGSCPLVIRVEDGLLSEIEGNFLEFWAEFVKPRRVLLMGSMVLVGRCPTLAPGE